MQNDNKTFEWSPQEKEDDKSAGHPEIKSILFDMDNTLFDFIEAKHAACNAIVEYLGLKESRELFNYFLRACLKIR